MPRTLRRTTTKADDREPVTDVHPEESEDSTPARGRRRGSDDEKPARARRGGSAPADDDEDDRVEVEVASGWGGYQKKRTESSGFAPEFNSSVKKGEPDILFRFIDEAPLAVYRQHWIERTGKKSFTCLENKGCPLCEDAGDKPQTKVVFNVISLEDPNEPKVMLWTVSQKVADIVQKFAGDKKTTPINRDDLYWSINKTGTKGGGIQTNLSPVKARDLEEDWDTAPLDEDELGGLEEEAFTKEKAVERPSKKQLEDVADEMLAG